MEERIVWTALPNGVEGGDLRLSVFVAPQLDPSPGPARLDSFASWVDWPATLSGMRFRVSFQSGRNPAVTLDARPDPSSSPASSELWRHLFPPDTPLAVFRQKRLDRKRVRSYPTTNILRFLEKPYRACAVQSPTRRPPIQVLADPEGGFGKLVRPSLLRKLAARVGEEAAASRRGRPGAARTVDPQAQAKLITSLRRDVARDLEPLFAGRKFIAAGPIDPPNDFLQARLFQLPRTVHRLPERIPLPEMDFHRMVSTLGQHPELLRRTGLVLDLLMPLGDTPPPDQGQVWLELGGAPAADHEMPRTEYALDGAGGAFAARPSPGSDLEGRLLALGRSEFAVVQLDVDGALQKIVQLADNLQRAISPALRTADSPERASMPSLRSAGLSVVRTGRAEKIHRMLIRARDLRVAIKSRELSRSEPRDSLWAEDLTRGYRVDVLEGAEGDDPAWRSLCSRIASYDLGGQSPRLEVEDEGWTASAATESTSPDGEDDEIYIQESLFRWAGWSLVTPRPGKHLDENQEASAASHDATSGLPLTVVTRGAPGTLPKLRFGSRYRVRARTVDLAGNSLSLDEADRLPEATADRVATAEIAYLRHEVVTQPVLRLQRSLDEAGPGEGMERLVIRSLNQGPAQPDERVAPTELSGQSSVRHVAPPGVGQLTAETHGMFDVDGAPDAAAYATITGRDGEFRSDVYPESQLRVPYLPDPVARGAAFVGLPRTGDPDNTVTLFRADGSVERRPIEPAPRSPVSVVQVELGPSRWPDSEPFRLQSVATQEPRDPSWDSAARVLTVYVPPGETVSVRYSSYLGRDDLESMATWRWIVEEGRDAELEDRVLAGLHWMLTPYRRLTLVHAVQRPLIQPEFQRLESHRIEAQTSTDLADEIPVSGKSTARLDIEARWPESLDDGEAPRRIERGGHAFDLSVGPTDTKVKFGPAETRTWLPVQSVLANATLASTAQKLGVVPQSIKVLQGQPTAPATPPQLSRSAEAVVARPRGPAAEKLSQVVARTPVGAFQRVPAQALSPERAEIEARTRTLGRHELGDTKHRRITYTAVATSRYRDDLPFSSEEIAEAEASGGGRRITRLSEPVTLDVLSSARPAAPEVVYVIPTFGWETRMEGGERRRVRRGGGLRVYLERPWFSSGEGELLGVVVSPRRPGLIPGLAGGRGPDREKLLPYITQWGMDPLWRTSPPGSSRSPELSSFHNAVATESGLTLAELPDTRVSVAGFPVGEWSEEDGFRGWDPARKLWFCDLDIDPGDSYFPFVRLALVRYQPKSLAWQGGDVKLSRVVVADYAQLAPDRVATVTPVSETRVRVTLSGITAKESGEQKFGLLANVQPPRPGVATPGLSPRRFRAQAGETNRPLRESLTAGPLGRLIGNTDTGGNSVEVSLESLPAGAREDLGWAPVPDSTVELEPLVTGGPRAVWSSEVSLPEPRGSRRFRLLLKEYEWFVTEGERVETATEIRRPTGSRLVYVDTLEI